MNLKLYGNNLERVECFCFLGVYFDLQVAAGEMPLWLWRKQL